MHRHEIEAEDESTHTVVREHCAALRGGLRRGDGHHVRRLVPRRLRHELSRARGSGGSGRHHCAGLGRRIADLFDGDTPWDVVDLRRLRGVDPALGALDAAMQAVGGARGWRGDARGGRRVPGRHRAGRHVGRVPGHARQEAIGTRSGARCDEPPTVGDLTSRSCRRHPQAIEDFISAARPALRRDGLFPDNEGGATQPALHQRLAELELAKAPAAQLHVARVTLRRPADLRAACVRRRRRRASCTTAAWTPRPGRHRQE